MEKLAPLGCPERAVWQAKAERNANAGEESRSAHSSALASDRDEEQYLGRLVTSVIHLDHPPCLSCPVLS